MVVSGQVMENGSGYQTKVVGEVRVIVVVVGGGGGF